MRQAACLAWIAWIAWIAWVAAPAHGQDATNHDAGATRPAPADGAPLGLDRLLNPRVDAPSSAASGRPGGKDRETWQREFEQAYTEVRQLRGKVEESQRRMRDAAGDTNYSYSPAGGGETYDPEVLKARAQIQRDRQSLEAAERRLRDLKVEASLAGVPQAWQQSPGEAPPPGD
jgi:hypothetical protein